MRMRAVAILLWGIGLSGGVLPAYCAPGAPAVSYTIGNGGLSALAYDGQSLLPKAENGALRVAGDPVFHRMDGSTYALPSYMPVRTDLDAARHTVSLTYAWGAIACVYKGVGSRLSLNLSVHNATRDTLTGIKIQLIELGFPAVPRGRVLDAGMFGTSGNLHPLHEYPLSADPHAMPPVLLIDYGAGAIAFCSDDPTLATSVSVPYSTNPPAKTRYPLWALPGAVAPGKTVVTNLSLRFGSGGASAKALAEDVLTRYAAAYPFQLRWTDHRSIGTLFLSSNGAHPATNPRGWFNNAADVDVTSPAGLARFRERLLNYADESITVLKGMGAQGTIAWDPEGQEFTDATYYGDPRLTSRLAPETDYKGAAILGCMDAFFKKFRDAGLRVGVCIRPQEIHFVQGAPRQDDSPDPVATLKSKIEYARKRWGCTLFYVDSTVKGNEALDADVFRQAASAFPDVLLMPENETLRDYAYTAPLNSFQHHAVTSTPPGVRDVYPRAFSVLLAGDGDFTKYHDALVAAVRRGDILLFHGWWNNPVNARIRAITEEAKRPGAR